ncbi:hypothetical protein L6452_44278 [Arctium lappa]|uniref:Uncharacterized protein n=1 Tax=Arctium lappa TaxID=4217 RepID=A0ACB8XH24_ARCLA|nr:hypothetical protein L6452_44278 [Arctium lappa]
MEAMKTSGLPDQSPTMKMEAIGWMKEAMKRGCLPDPSLVMKEDGGDRRWMKEAMKRATKSKPHDLPPTPFALPIVGHLHLLSGIPHQSFHKLSLRYGPIIHLYLGSQPCILASSPEIVKQLLKTNENSFLNRPEISAIDYLTYGSKDFSFAPYGPYWKFMKKIVMSQLLNGPTLDLLRPVRRDEIERFIWLLLRKSRGGIAVDVDAELIKLANNVISRMVMGGRCSEGENEAGKMRRLVTEVVEITGTLNVSDYVWFCKDVDLQGFGKKLKDIRRRVDELIDRIIEEHEEMRKEKKVEVKDLLHILLDIEEDESMEIKLSRENIKAFILFKPERFEENQLDVRGQHFHMLPFGSGRRMCPGMSLALHVVHATLGAMIQCFEWKAVGKDGRNLASLDMEEGIGMTLPRANPLVCVPVARLDPIPLSI